VYIYLHGMQDSNLQPLVLETTTLPIELIPCDNQYVKEHYKSPDLLFMFISPRTYYFGCMTEIESACLSDLRFTDGCGKPIATSYTAPPENFEISTYRLTADCSASELQGSIFYTSRVTNITILPCSFLKIKSP